MPQQKTGRKTEKGNVRRLFGSYAVCVVCILCAAALAFFGITAAGRTETLLGESTVKMPDYIRQADLSPLARSIPSLCGPVFANLAYGIAETAELLQGA